MKKILEQVKGRDFDIVRVILLSKSFAFNLDIKAFREIEDEKQKKQTLQGLIYQYRLPANFIQDYSEIQKLNMDDLETQLCVYEVYDRASGGDKNVIDQDGLYIKFDPNKTDRFYKKVIKRLRSAYEFQQAEEKDKKEFIRRSGKSHYQYNALGKAAQKRRQHGSNFEQDIKVYLTCENTFRQINSTPRVNTGYGVAAEKDNEAFIKNALDFAAEKLKMSPQRVKSIYYEVCKRYSLPTLVRRTPPPEGFVRS